MNTAGVTLGVQAVGCSAVAFQGRGCQCEDLPGGRGFCYFTYKDRP